MVHGLATFASALTDVEELSLNPRAYVYAVKPCIPPGLAAANQGDAPPANLPVFGSASDAQKCRRPARLRFRSLDQP